MIQKSHNWAYILRKTYLRMIHVPPVFIAVLFTIAWTWKQTRCPLIDEWIKKLWYIWTVSHKKEWIWVSSSEASEPRASYTEWNKSEKNDYLILTYVWNLEEWYWWTYLQGSSRDADMENGLVDIVRERQGGMNWESNMNIYITICKINSQ